MYRQSIRQRTGSREFRTAHVQSLKLSLHIMSSGAHDVIAITSLRLQTLSLSVCASLALQNSQ